MKRPHPFPTVAGLGLALLATGPAATAQTQSLAFTGGVLLNTKVGFHNLGAHATSAQPGAATGSAVDRTYDDGFNRVDDTGNLGETTANWGYQRSDQLRTPGQMVLSHGSADGTASLEDVGSFIEPSGNLEYRGSLGPLGSSDWGILLGIGYQSVGSQESASFVTDARILEDSFATGSPLPGEIPPAPYSGSASSTGFRLGSAPARTERTSPGGRFLTGSWELDAEMLPLTGGLYIETQIAGRLNAVVSAGLMAIFINADLKYRESSTISPLPTVTSAGSEGTNDFVIGGFTQLGLDWALWEKASLVASARWQPAESFNHSAGGRQAEIDFMGAFAVHAGFAFRF